MSCILPRRSRRVSAWSGGPRDLREHEGDSAEQGRGLDAGVLPLALARPRDEEPCRSCSKWFTRGRLERQEQCVEYEGEVVVERWHDQKHKEQRFIHDWVKLHAATGTLTNVVTAARVTVGMGTGAGDSPQFRDLVDATARRFQMKEVSADKAYLAEDNLDAIAAVGALPFVPFKSNSREMDHPNEHWRKMWAYFDLKAEEFLRHYHRRSNVESTFGAMKAKFGGSVRSKMFVAQQNEVLAKVLLWNLSCIVHAIEEFGVEAEFSRLVMP